MGRWKRLLARGPHTRWWKRTKSKDRAGALVSEAIGVAAAVSFQHGRAVLAFADVSAQPEGFLVCEPVGRAVGLAGENENVDAAIVPLGDGVARNFLHAGL